MNSLTKINIKVRIDCYRVPHEQSNQDQQRSQNKVLQTEWSVDKLEQSVLDYHMNGLTSSLIEKLEQSVRDNQMNGLTKISREVRIECYRLSHEWSNLVSREQSVIESYMNGLTKISREDRIECIEYHMNSPTQFNRETKIEC